jgi:hypothetical protein
MRSSSAASITWVYPWELSLLKPACCVGRVLFGWRSTDLTAFFYYSEDGVIISIVHVVVFI